MTFPLVLHTVSAPPSNTGLMQFKGMGQVLVVEGKPSQQVFWHRGDGGRESKE